MKKVKLRLVVLAVMLVVLAMFTGCSKSSKDSSKGYERGTINGSTYESEFLNIKFTAPEGYNMLTQEDMDPYIQFTSEVIYKDKDKKMIDYAKAVTVYEMMAQEPTIGSPNVNIVVENLKGRDVTIDQYIEACKQQLANTGIEYTFGDIENDVDLAGSKYTLLNCVGKYGDQEIPQQMYIRKVDDRMMLLTVTYSEDDIEARDTLVQGFTAYK